MRLWLIGLAIILLYGAIFFTVSRLVYQPTRYPRGWWHTQSECGAQDVWLRTSDGVRLHAWWVAAPGSRLATLYLHGNGANLSHRPGHIREMAAAGTSILMIDYRGYGKSEGHPTERGLYRDADAGYDYLIATGYRPEQIVVHGESLGSAVAADLAARRPCAGLVLECHLTSLSAMAGRIVPWFGAWFANGFDTRRKVAAVHAPLLVIHGDRDRTVPYTMGRAVFEAGHQPKSFYTVPGAGHKTIVQDGGERYRAELRSFYESLPGSL
ncbi:MAG: alpha/beta hydrolase [Bryobacteraceae bacterium]